MLKLHLKVCRKMLKRYYKCFSRRFPSYWMYRFLLASSLLSLSLFFFLGGGARRERPPLNPCLALGPLQVRFSKIASPLGPLCIRSWVRFTHSCVKRTPLCCYRLQAPPLVYSKYTVQPVHYVLVIRSIHTCSTVRRFHGEHQENHKNFALYSAKNCYSE